MEPAQLLIDTSILIEYLRKSKKEETTFYRLAARFDYTVSAVTQFELQVGITVNNRPFIEQVMTMLVVLPFDARCANQAVAIYQELKSSNQLISMADIFIAATAMALDIPLLTLNRKHFERIKPLKLYAATT